MKRIFAFLLTALLLIGMAAVTVQADEAKTGYTLTLSQTGGQRGETIKIEYRLKCQNVKVIQIQPEIPDELEFVSDKWEISGSMVRTFLDSKMLDAALFTANNPVDLDGVIYTVTYKIKNSDSVTDGKYPLGYTIFTVKTKTGDASETVLYNYDASDTTKEPEVEGAGSIAITPGEIDVHQHDETCMVWVDTVDPTCMEEGADAHWECNKGHQAYQGTKDKLTVPLRPRRNYVLPIIAHNFEKEVNGEIVESSFVDPPTCTKDGAKKPYLECTICHNYFDYDDETVMIDELKFQEEYFAEALGHTILPVPKKDATCEESGYKAFFGCTICRTPFSDADGKTPLTEADLLAYVIPPKGHKYQTPSYGWSDDHKTCTAKTVCENDSTHNIIETVNATVAEKKPTCTEQGGMTSVAVFKNENFKTQTHVQDPAASALGHLFTADAHVAAKDATCDTEGNAEYWHCSRCDKNFKDNAKDTTAEIEDVVIPAKGHDYDYANASYTWSNDHKTCTAKAVCKNDDTHFDEETATATVTQKEATCTEQGGLTSVAVFKNTNFKTQTFVADPTDALGHNFSAADAHVEAKEEDCVAAGNVEYWHCSKCGKNFKDNAKDTTAEIKDVVIPALGHDWSDWEETKEPTTTEEGEEQRICSRCKTVQKRAIPKIDDSLPDGFEKAMAYYRNQQRQLAAERAAKKAAEEAAAKKAAEEAAKAAEEAAKAAEEAGKDGFGPEIPAIDDTWVNPFIDVFETDSYYDAVRYVNEAGLFYGMTPTEFGPAVTMNRAMFVTVLGRLAGVDPDAYPTTSFTDVDPIGEWNFAPYVEWAAQNGIVLGYGGGKFGPEDMITVEQAAVILARYAKYLGMDTTSEALLSTFTDGDSVSDWAADALAWAAENGIYLGTDEGALNPQSFAARSLIATMLYNFANVSGK